MKKYRIDYLHITGKREFETDSVFELFRRFEELLEDDHVTDHSLVFTTSDNTVVNHFPVYEPTQQELATEKEYIEFKGGKK